MKPRVRLEFFLISFVFGKYFYLLNIALIGPEMYISANVTVFITL